MELRQIYLNTQVHVPADFKNKVYIKIGDVLRAAYLQRIDLHPCSSTWEVACTFKIAGLGIREEEMTDISGIRPKIEHFRVYKNIEQYKRKELSNQYVLTYDCAKILEEAFKGIATIASDRNIGHNVQRYKWNGTDAIPVVLFGDIWIDAEGVHTDAKIPSGTYPTKQACESDNQISVIEFDD